MFGNFFKNVNFLKYIDLRVFLLSFIIGIGMVYLTAPDKRVIYVYPTPENADVLQYRDKTGSCFQVKQTEVSCPKNDSEISKVPPQS